MRENAEAKYRGGGGMDEVSHSHIILRSTFPCSFLSLFLVFVSLLVYLFLLFVRLGLGWGARPLRSYPLATPLMLMRIAELSRDT